MPDFPMRIERLALNCRQSRETIDFSPNISLFHGEMGTGKSSIARLVDYCLGGGIERTPAIQRELLSATLTATVGANTVLFERPVTGSHVAVTWTTEGGNTYQVNAPRQASKDPVWRDGDGAEYFNISDMIYYFVGRLPPLVRKNKVDADAELIRLSFRDVMWYCFLQQEDMESNFFNLETPILAAKSRDVVRYVLGFHSEAITELEVRLDSLVNDQRAKQAAATQIQQFIARFGIGTAADVLAERARITELLATARAAQGTVRQELQRDTHFVDDLRERLRGMSVQLQAENQAVVDLQARLDEVQSLRAELLVTKFKLARTDIATQVLDKVRFDFCPACGSTLIDRTVQDGHCVLCLQDLVINPDAGALANVDAINQDIDARLVELDEAIRRHSEAVASQTRLIESLIRDKQLLDARLQEEVSDYDSAYLARIRELEREVATLEERLAGLDRIGQLPEAIQTLRLEAAQLDVPIGDVRQQIQSARQNTEQADAACAALEDAYREALLAVRFPDIHVSDSVRIDKGSWQPMILPRGDRDLAWGYYSAGSGGKKTLLKVCYGLALHAVAAQLDLPLPSLLIVDTPMKNIGPVVNQGNYSAFYSYLLRLAEGPLRNCQIVIIESEDIVLPETDVRITDRKLMLNDPRFPRLISYYHGETG